MSNDSLPVEYLNGEFGLAFSSTFTKNEKTFCKVLCNIPEDFKDKYKDKVLLVNTIPVEKQKEFIECFKTNDKDTINTTLEIIMNDYSKYKTEIFAENKNATIYDHSEISDTLMFPFYKRPDLPVIFTNKRKSRHHTTKHQPNKKSKKSARRNNRRAKRNNR